MIYWFTGQPGHGKTTICLQIKEYLENKNIKVIHIDGDDMRQIFNNVNYAKEGRLKNVELAQDIAKFCSAQGFHVLVSLVSPYREQRELFKNTMKNEILEFYVHTDEIRGREKYHILDYERPLENFVELDTTWQHPKDMLNYIIKLLNI